MFERILNFLFGRRRKPMPSPQPDPDPVLPAKTLSFQWGKDPQQTVTLCMPARRASQPVPAVEFAPASPAIKAAGDAAEAMIP